MIRTIFISAILSSVPVFAQGPDAEAQNLLARARESVRSDDRSFGVLCVRESYLLGSDTLRGSMDFRDARGERRLVLSGGGESFEWWSRLYGREQWRRDESTGRLRRIAPHSIKKPALSSVPFSYEDLARLPLGYFDGFRSCSKLQETDSTYELTLSLSPGASSRYATAQVTLGKSPVLLRRVVFSGGAGRPSKSLEVLQYRMENGKQSPAEIRVSGGDGLASVRLLFTPRALSPAQDKTLAPTQAGPARPVPSLESRDKEDGAE